MTMRTLIASGSIGALALSSVIVAAPVGGQEVVGVNSAVRNDVKTRRNAQSDYHPAVIKEKVTLGNQVRTGGSSALQVTLLDKSNLTVGPNAFFTVDRFVYDPRKNASSIGASVAKGTFRFMSGKAHKEGANTVKTPAASIGIRGTILEGAVGPDALLAARQQGLTLPAKTDPETATFIVLRGPGPHAQMGEAQGRIDVSAGGRTITLDQPGQALFIPRAGAAPMSGFNVSVPAFATFDEVLRTTPVSFAPTLAALTGSSPPAIAGSAGTGRAGTIASSSVPKAGHTGLLLGSLAGIASLSAIVIASSNHEERFVSNGV